VFAQEPQQMALVIIMRKATARLCGVNIRSPSTVHFCAAATNVRLNALDSITSEKYRIFVRMEGY
jgi:hypothetical protein